MTPSSTRAGDAGIGSDEDEIVSISPWDGEALGARRVTRADEVAEIVRRARAAGRAWAREGAPRRAQRIVALARLIDDHRDPLAELIAREVGKPISDARAEVLRAVQICSYYGGAGMDLGGVIRGSFDPSVTIHARTRPIGVVGAITPWNFPLAIPLWKIVPGLVAGCAIVWKPAPSAVLTAGRLAELAAQAGVPVDVFTCLFGGESLGGALTAADLDGLTFTGSTASGKRVRAATQAAGSARLQLELGGVNIAHVLPDADVDNAADAITTAAFGYAGQKCTATQVVAVRQEIADELIEALKLKVSNLAAGDPLDPLTLCGPVIDALTAQRLAREVEQLHSNGQVIAMGPEVSAPAYARPILFESDRPDGPLVRHELFGPVATLIRTDGPADHVRLAQLSGTGLCAAVYGQDMDAVGEMVELADAGVIAVNRPSTGLDPHVPFGGWKSSGGDFPEQGTEGLRFFLKWQSVYWKAK